MAKDQTLAETVTQVQKTLVGIPDRTSEAFDVLEKGMTPKAVARLILVMDDLTLSVARLSAVLGTMLGSEPPEG